MTLLFDTIPINFYTRVALCLTIYGVSINIEHFHVDVVAVVFFFFENREVEIVHRDETISNDYNFADK